MHERTFQVKAFLSLAALVMNSNQVDTQKNVGRVS